MGILEQIREQNDAFRDRVARAVLGLVRAALEQERDRLDAPADVHRALNLTGFSNVPPGCEPPTAHALARAAQTRAFALYEYVDDLYRRTVARASAFTYEEDDDLARLRAQLRALVADQVGRLDPASTTSLQAMLARDRQILEARSRREIDKSSYTGVRRVSLEEERARRDLQGLGEARAAQLGEVYERLDALRMRVAAHERQRARRLRQGQARVMNLFKDYLRGLAGPVETMTALGPLSLPGARTLADLATADLVHLGEVFYKMLAADRTFLARGPDRQEGEDPMPRLVLLPVSGHVTLAAPQTASRLREHVVLCPLRPLEDPVAGVARELLKLKQRRQPRLVAAQREALDAFCRDQGLKVDSWESVLVVFYRFAAGEAEAQALGEDMQAVLREHVIPEYTQDLFLPPQVRPALARCPPGPDEGREAFKRIASQYRDDPFVLGALYADRAARYDAYLREARVMLRGNRKLVLQYIHSRRSNREAAKHHFLQCHLNNTHRRLALYNSAVLLAATPPGAGENVAEQHRGAVRLFRESLRDEPNDLWAFKARQALTRLEAATLPFEELPDAWPAPPETSGSGRRPGWSGVTHWMRRALGRTRVP